MRGAMQLERQITSFPLSNYITLAKPLNFSRFYFLNLAKKKRGRRLMVTMFGSSSSRLTRPFSGESRRSANMQEKLLIHA